MSSKNDVVVGGGEGDSWFSIFWGVVQLFLLIMVAGL